MDLGPVDYTSPIAPPNYRCSTCGAHGCKLWRDYNVFLEHQTLECCDCAGAGQGRDVSSIDDDGRCLTPDDETRTDQIGWRIPAVPTEDGTTYWGYTSVPDAGVWWWRRLPTRSPSTLASLAEQARRRADRMGCVLCTQGGGMPAPSEVLMDIGRAWQTETASRETFLRIAGMALFGASLTPDPGATKKGT